MATKHRINLSITPDIYRNLDYVANQLGVSRSALVSELLGEPLQIMVDALGGLDMPRPSEESVMRARGQSLDRIGELVDHARVQYQGLVDSGIIKGSK